MTVTFNQHNVNGVGYISSPNITARHGFTTRLGGVSAGIYDSLNLRMICDDDRENIKENYRLLAEAAGLDYNKYVFSNQVHKDDIRICTEKDGAPPFTKIDYEADGLITNVSGRTLVIFTADCTPILLYDPVAGAVGAVHAGWRGTVMDIAGKAVKKMGETFGSRPENIKAAIGPCISKCCFETGSEVYDAVYGVIGSKADEFCERKPDGKYMTDLKGINRYLLKRVGVSDISVTDECTMCLDRKYWSHRATKGIRGSQCSFIVLD